MKTKMKQYFFLPISAFCISMLMVIGITEVVFHIFPPTGTFAPGYQFDPDIGYRFKPYSEIIYNKANGLVKNSTNQEGWVDVDHNKDKENSQFRVAFFGDSYIEGLGTPSALHFFRNLPQKVSGTPMEYFGFGMSGFGTIQSYINSMRYLNIYDFDLVVYVFVENDIGDNIWRIKKLPNRPYAIKTVSEPGFMIEKHFSDELKLSNEFPYNLKGYLKSQSLLLQVVTDRISLLKRGGIKLKANEKDMGMKTQSKGDIPNQNDLPSSWPEKIKTEAQELAFSIIKKWSSEIKKTGKHFAVLYVPRGPDYLTEKAQAKNTFKGWLVSSCKRLNIPLIDPSKALLKKQEEGGEVYRDHFFLPGHEVLNDVISEWLDLEFEINRIGQAKVSSLNSFASRYDITD